MPTKANRAIGSLDFSDAERRKLAMKSRTWRCETCGLIKDLLVHPDVAKIEPNNQEEATAESSSSRVQEEPSSSSANLKNKKSSNNSDSESSDSINDIEGSEPQSPIYDTSSERSFGACNNSSPRANGRALEQHPAGEQNVRRLSLDYDIVEPRRAYPPLVLKSIFILLSLLILRRVVMVIQA